MQSRALPFNGAVGCVSYIGQSSVSAGSAMTSPTFNLNADTRIEFDGSIKVTSGSNNLTLTINSDTTATNYDLAVLVHNGTTPVSANRNSALLVTMAANTIYRFDGKITVDAQGFATIEMTISYNQQGSLQTGRITLVWRTSGTNVTNLTFTVSVAGSATGSALWYKRSPLIALNNAANLDVTANPSNPVHLQRVRRVDATTIANLGGPAWVYYDATLAKWLTEELFRQPITANEDVGVNGTTGNNPRGRFFEPTYDVYVGRIIVQSYVATTSNGSNKYTPTFNGFSGTPSFTTGADAANTFVNHSFTLGTITTAPMGIQIDSNKVGAPGPLYLVGHIQYRLVIP